MSFFLECKKVKRTGFLPAFIGGGVLAAAVPIINMAVRSENYLGLNTPPIQTLLNANWQTISMLNILLVVIGACILYHTEYADNAIQRISTLPTRESTMFLGKFGLTALMCLVVIAAEAAAVAFCTVYWFEQPADFIMEILKNFGYSFLLLLPAALLSLIIASACKNMWISLGIGVICVFTAAMLPSDNFALSLFPFALPFQTLAGKVDCTVYNYCLVGGVEIVTLVLAEMIFLKIRRSFE